MAANPTGLTTIYMAFGVSGSNDGTATDPFTRWETIVGLGQGYLTNKLLLIQRGRTRNTNANSGAWGASGIPDFTNESNFIIDSVGDLASLGGPTPNASPLGDEAYPVTYGAQFETTSSLPTASLPETGNTNQFLDDGGGGYAETRGVTINNLQLVNYPTGAEMELDTARGMYWDGSTIWININITTGGNRVINVTRNGDSSPYVIAFNSCTNFIVRNVAFERGANGGINLDNCIDYTIRACRVRNVGNWDPVNGGGQQCIRLAGTVGGGNPKSTGGLLEFNSLSFAVNNLLEMKDCDGIQVTRNVGMEAGMGLEIWGYVTNCTYTNNAWRDIENMGTSQGHGNCVWFTSATLDVGETGNSTGNTFDGDIYDNTKFTMVEVAQENPGNTWNRCSFLGADGRLLDVIGSQSTPQQVDRCMFDTHSGSNLVANNIPGTVSYGNNLYFTSSVSGFSFRYDNVVYPTSSLTDGSGPRAYREFADASGDTGAWGLIEEGL